MWGAVDAELKQLGRRVLASNACTFNEDDVNPIEQSILSGSEAEIESLMGGENSLGVDWQSEEDEVLAQLKRLVPGFGFESHCTDSHFEASLQFLGRTRKVTLSFQPQNCFRVVLSVADLLQPEYGIRIYEPTLQSDTHAFFVGSQEFWSRFDNEVAPEKKKLFAEIDNLNRMWSLFGKTPLDRVRDLFFDAVLSVAEGIGMLLEGVYGAWSRFRVPRCPNCRNKLRTRLAQQCVECGWSRRK